MAAKKRSANNRFSGRRTAAAEPERWNNAELQKTESHLHNLVDRPFFHPVSRRLLCRLFLYGSPLRISSISCAEKALSVSVFAFPNIPRRSATRLMVLSSGASITSTRS